MVQVGWKTGDKVQGLVEKCVGQIPIMVKVRDSPHCGIAGHTVSVVVRVCDRYYCSSLPCILGPNLSSPRCLQ